MSQGPQIFTSEKGNALSKSWSVVSLEIFVGGRQKMINVSIPQVALKILSVLFEEQPDDELRSISGILQSLKKKGRIYTNDRNIIVTVFRRIFWNHPKNPPYYIDVLTASSLHHLQFLPTWELQHLIPGHAGQGSARSDFASIIINNNDLQFAFFIVEFEQAGFEIHKDEVVVVAELAYEFNRILSQMHYPTEMEVNETSLHFGLAKVENVLRLITYLRETVCVDGMRIRSLLNRRPVQFNYNLKLALPELPKEAVQSRKFETKFTPVTMRGRKYIAFGKITKLILRCYEADLLYTSYFLFCSTKKEHEFTKGL
ncbi:7540_t:CDS:2 [Funneliformis caledonium]|uniref:7540_t:CDS:1 n=1 Tax=Funneliformis caledonium TaxID=1117310 RepID=A0A9N8ZI83_9GLOM|nr:7540_t:CDS:2 [Funneliformis caledonium]